MTVNELIMLLEITRDQYGYGDSVVTVNHEDGRQFATGPVIEKSQAISIEDGNVVQNEAVTIHLE